MNKYILLFTVKIFAVLILFCADLGAMNLCGSDCNQCGKSCSEIDMEDISKVKKYQCPLCEKSYQSQKSLKRHNRDKHNVEPNMDNHGSETSLFVIYEFKKAYSYTCDADEINKPLKFNHEYFININK